MRCLMAVAAIALAVAGPSAALAATARPTNPPSPKDTREAAEAWADEYVVADHYMLAAVQRDYGAMLFDPASVRIEGEYVSAIVRGELFKPERILGVRQRSFRDRWLFDCAGRRSKEVFSEAFPQANLQGAPVQLDVSKVDWTDFAEGEGLARLERQVCSLGSLARPGVDRAKAMPADSFDTTVAGATAWMNSHIDAGKDKLVTAVGGIGVYYDPTSVTRGEHGLPKFWRRAELSVLLPSDDTAWRSMREEMEVDCLGYRFLRTRQEIYPGSNLLGDVVRHDTSDEGWTEVTAGSHDARWLRPMCAALSGEPAPEREPGPRSNDPEAVAEWVNAYVNTNNYVFAAQVAGGVMFYGTDDLALGDRGHVLATVRMELFEPVGSGASTGRSVTQRMEMDCRRRRQREIESKSYPGLNLTGSASRGPGADWEVLEPETVGAKVLIQVWGQISLIDATDPAKSMPTPPRDTSEAAIEAWLGDHIDATDYAPAGYGESSAALYSTKELERTREGYIRIWTRMEYFRPTLFDDHVVRSMRMLVEFDCKEHRSRTLALEAFPGSNLTGTKSEEKKDQAEWSFISPQALLSFVANDVCDLKDADDEDARDPARALPSPSPQQKL